MLIRLLTDIISLFEPPKYFESVKIDIPLELENSYPLVICNTSASKLIFGFEGDFLLNSEIIPDFSIKDFLSDKTPLLKYLDFSILDIGLFFLK